MGRGFWGGLGLACLVLCGASGADAQSDRESLERRIDASIKAMPPMVFHFIGGGYPAVSQVRTAGCRTTITAADGNHVFDWSKSDNSPEYGMLSITGFSDGRTASFGLADKSRGETALRRPFDTLMILLDGYWEQCSGYKPPQPAASAAPKPTAPAAQPAQAAVGASPPPSQVLSLNAANEQFVRPMVEWAPDGSKRVMPLPLGELCVTQFAIGPGDPSTWKEGQTQVVYVVVNWRKEKTRPTLAGRVVTFPTDRGPMSRAFSTEAEARSYYNAAATLAGACAGQVMR